MRKKNLTNYSNKEISVALNNCVAHCLRPQGRIIPEARLRRLRAFTHALLEPFKEFMEGGVDDLGPFSAALEPHEVVAIFVTAALFVQLQNNGTGKLPHTELAEELFGEMLPEDIDENN